MLAHLDRIDFILPPAALVYPRPVPRPTVMTSSSTSRRSFTRSSSRPPTATHARCTSPARRLADRVITISEFSRRAIVEHHRLPAERVAMVYLCADERYARSAGVARAPAASLPARFIFYPANLWKHKNHDVLLRALRLLREERGRRVDLVLTGFGQDNGYPLPAMAEAHGLGDQVHALGYLAVEELAYLYQRADMLVFPSLFEGFGIPLVEAMTAGCPIVAARATSIPELTADAAELFDAASPAGLAAAIERVLDDEAWRDTLRARGLARSRRVLPGQDGGQSLRRLPRGDEGLLLARLPVAPLGDRLLAPGTARVALAHPSSTHRRAVAEGGPTLAAGPGGMIRSTCGPRRLLEYVDRSLRVDARQVGSRAPEEHVDWLRIVGHVEFQTVVEGSVQSAHDSRQGVRSSS